MTQQAWTDRVRTAGVELRGTRGRAGALAIGALIALSAGAPALAQSGPSRPVLKEDEWALVSQPEIRRAEVGAKRIALNKLELSPFSPEQFAKLDSWTNGPALDGTNTKDKVVALVFWAEWRGQRVTALVERLAKLASEKASQGLVVVLVHDKEGWEKGAEWLKSKGLTTLAAHDKTNDFRKALLSDGVPEVYLIDRAGQMRFADIEPGAVADGIELLLKETRDDAVAAPERWRAGLEKQRAERGKTRDVSDTKRPDFRADVVVSKPPREAYARAFWPKKNEDKEQVEQDKQEKAFDADMSKVSWLGPKPDLQGFKVIVVSFWATWADGFTRERPFMEDLASRYRDDLTVVALSGYPPRANTNGPYKENKNDVERFLRGVQTKQYQGFDQDTKVREWTGGDYVPKVYVMSTDGVVRWQGWPLNPEFRRAVEKVIENDPGVRARREAEAKAGLREPSAQR